MVVAIALAACTSPITPTTVPSATTARLTPNPTVTGPPSSDRLTPAPSVTPLPSPTASGWSTPTKIAKGVQFQPFDVVVDASGKIHVAAVGQAGMWYLTDAGGDWQSERITTAPFHQDTGWGADTDPSIAVEGGAVWIAFTRLQCVDCASADTDGVYYVTNEDGSWTAPRKLSGPSTGEPSMMVTEQHLFVAYSKGGLSGQSSIWYGNDARGSWSAQNVASSGTAPNLNLGADGLAGILFAELDNAGASHIALATAGADGSFAIEVLPGSADGRTPQLATDASGTTSAAWWTLSSDGSSQSVWFATRGREEWLEPLLTIAQGQLVDFAIDAAGAAHILASSDLGLLHASDASGAFKTDGLEPAAYIGAMTTDGTRVLVIYPKEGSDGKPAVWLVVAQFDTPDV